jgi:N-acetylglutamate synthase-like GNAT family acetyltransferase
VTAIISDAPPEAGKLAAALLKSDACWIAASVDGAIAGVAGVETIVDAAAIGALFVVPSMRGRGIGSMLVGAARKAAHTRGARRLYAPVPTGEKYLTRFGFESAGAAEMINDLQGASVAGYMLENRDEATVLDMLRLDISRDGVIER